MPPMRPTYPIIAAVKAIFGHIGARTAFRRARIGPRMLFAPPRLRCAAGHGISPTNAAMSKVCGAFAVHLGLALGVAV